MELTGFIADTTRNATWLDRSHQKIKNYDVIVNSNVTQDNKGQYAVPSGLATFL